MSKLRPVLIVAIMATAPLSSEAEQRAPEATAPAGTVALETTIEGWWFIRRELHAEYQGLLEAVSDIEKQVADGRLAARDARDRINRARSALEKLRKKIDDEKKLVSPFQILSKTEEETFELGPERLLVITADRVKLVGWDQPTVKCVLRKRVLSDGEPGEQHLDEIKVVRTRGVSTELTGRTEQEMQAWREEFVNPADKELTQEEREAREYTWRTRFAGSERFPRFAGKAVDAISMKGLTGDQGNRRLSFRIRSEDNSVFSSRWQRAAELTVFVPRCAGLLLRGCQGRVEITGLHVDLWMTASGSRDRDYEGRFTISDHSGDVTLHNVPMDSIRRVAGRVSIHGATEMANTGSRHSGEWWTQYTPEARELTLDGIYGGLKAYFQRRRLVIRNVRGDVNVRNDFGDTRWDLSKPLQAGKHRVVSQSGLIDLRLAANVQLAFPFFAATSCNTVSTNLGRDALDDLHVTTTDVAGNRRTWRAFSLQVASR